MDPDANLKEQRELAETLSEQGEVTDTDDIMRLLDDAARLAELVQGMDKWISKGGHLPQDWSTYYQTRQGLAGD